MLEEIQVEERIQGPICSCDLQNVNGITANPIQLDIEDWWTLTSVGSETSRDVTSCTSRTFDSLISPWVHAHWAFDCGEEVDR